MLSLAEELELEALRADGLERALRAVVRRLDPVILLSMADEIRELQTGSDDDQEGVGYAADLLCEAAADLALGPLFNGARDV